MKNIIGSLFILTLFVASSCLREPFDTNVPVVTNDNEPTVKFKLALPFAAPSQGMVRQSIGTEEENTIKTLDVLAFKVENGIETFQYCVGAAKVSDNEGASIQEFSAKLHAEEYRQRFVFITNAHSKIEALIESHPEGWIDKEKEAMLKNLTFDLNSNDRWNAISAANYTALPMWGESEPVIVTETTTGISNERIRMLRMIAKIEVQLDESVKNNFKLKGVYVYNTNTSGRIVPRPNTSTDIFVDDDKVAQKASLPDPVTTVVGPLKYDDFSSPGIPDVAMRGAIYLFETAGSLNTDYNNTDYLDETCIVVGGYFGSDEFETYYRIDFGFLASMNAYTHFDILRNHKYSLTIATVAGRGYPSVDEAYKNWSFNHNMIINYSVWDEGEIHTFVFDYLYRLGVSQTNVVFTHEAYGVSHTDNILKITTNYPLGWTADVWADEEGTTPLSNGWLDINPTEGAGGAQLDEMRLNVLENTTSASRTAYIHIRAGRLSVVVKVVQSYYISNVYYDVVEGTFTTPTTSQGSILDYVSGAVVAKIRLNGVEHDIPAEIDGFKFWTVSGGGVQITQNGHFEYVAPVVINSKVIVVDNFEFCVKDTEGNLSNWAWVYINIEDTVPVAVDDEYSVTGADSATDYYKGNVMDNDIKSLDGVNFVWKVRTSASGLEIEAPLPSVPFDLPTVKTAQGGSVWISSDGYFEYDPAPLFTGTDSFQYQLNDSDDSPSNWATVMFHVLALDSKTVTGFVWPMAVDDMGLGQSFLQQHDIVIELRTTFLTPAPPHLSVKATLQNSEGLGKFTFVNVPPGEYVLYIERPGYLVRTMKVSIPVSGPSEIVFAPPGETDKGIFNLWWGDCNGDWLIDSKDRMIIMGLMDLGYSVNVYDPSYKPAYDLNADGLIDNEDLMMVNENLEKEIVDYPGALSLGELGIF